MYFGRDSSTDKAAITSAKLSNLSNIPDISVSTFNMTEIADTDYPITLASFTVILNKLR